MQAPRNYLEDDDNAGSDVEEGLAAFQRQYENDHSWEDLQEDEFGRLLSLDTREEQREKRKRLISAAASARIKRGMIRYLQVIVDLSKAASISDMRPTRAAVMAVALQTFIREFFDQNPLSQLGVILMRNGIAEAVTELSGSPETHIKKLRANLDAAGDASLQNALQTAVNALSTIPPYGHREVLIVFAAMSTCDPGNIRDTIKAAKEARCRVSVVGIAAEVYICRQIVEATGGVYGVAKDEQHFQELLMEHGPPPPTKAAELGASLVRMGFPRQNAHGPSAIAFVGPDCVAKAGGYTCPRCKARVADIPSSCHICLLTLVSSPHLARSYHHLFPVPAFAELNSEQLQTVWAEEWRESGSRVWCFGCLQTLDAFEEQPLAEDPGVIVRCPDCLRVFCFECDAYVHESLHNCPGCECLVGEESQMDTG